MAEMMECPNCGEAAPRRAMECPHCGANIALAVAVAERRVARGIETRPLPQLAPELLIPRLGDFLVQRGYITVEQLEAGLAYQQREAALGQAVLLGQALIALGLLERADLDAAVTEQILALQEALRKTNQDLDGRVKARTEQLENALLRLTELGELKNNFISNVSHELRTPLTHLSGYLELMAEGALGPVSEAQDSALEVMIRAYKRLDGLIENLIQVAVMAQGEMGINPQLIAPADLLAAAVERNASLAQQRGVTVRVEAEPGLPAVEADPEKLGWTLEHLLENAIKFNQEGGWVKVSASRQGQGIRFEVRDNGVGIPAEKINEIFEPFHQLDGSSTRQVGGAGLGLALVQQIVEAHHSQMEVVSEAGQGACFSFVLGLSNA